MTLPKLPVVTRERRRYWRSYFLIFGVKTVWSGDGEPEAPNKRTTRVFVMARVERRKSKTHKRWLWRPRCRD